MSSKMKELSKKLMKSDAIPNDTDLLNFFNEFLAWLNTGFNKSRPLPKSHVNKYITMSIPLLLKIDPCSFVNLIPIVLKILAILVHPQTDKDIREAVWRLSISLIDSKTKYMTPNSWNQLIDSAFSKKEREPNFNSGTPSTYSYESNCNLLIIYFNTINTMCNNNNNPNLNQDSIEIKKKVIYHWELISELIFVHIFNVTPENYGTLDQLCFLILQCINNCQKTFKFVFFATDIGGPQMINYLLDILLRIENLSTKNPLNDNSFKLLYKFCKLTFPCQIFTIDQKHNRTDCNKNRQIAEKITPTINKNYLFFSKSNNSSNSNISNSSNNRSSSNKPKFTINPLLLSLFDAIPSDEVTALLKNMSKNCKNFSPILINSIFIMINLIFPLLIKIQSKITYINNNFYINNNDNGNDNSNSNNNNTANLKIFDRAYLSFTTSDANRGVISSVAQLFSHCIRLRSLLQVVLKSSIDSRTFSAIVQLFFNIQKKEMYPFFVTVFFSILFDRRHIDMKEERDYIMLLMSFKFNMNYMPNLFARIASQISVALSTYVINIPEKSSQEIQANTILFDEKEIENEALVQIGKVSVDSLYFYFRFTANDFTTQTAKDFLVSMIRSFDPLFNNYFSLAATGAILSIIEWFKEKEKEASKGRIQQQIQQQRILERNLRSKLKNKRNRPKSHEFQTMKFSENHGPSDYKKLSSSSLTLSPVIDESTSKITRNLNLENINHKNVLKAEDPTPSNSALDSSASFSINETTKNLPSDNIVNQKNEDNNNDNLSDKSFYIDNVSYLKDLDLSFLFGYLLPYLMQTLAKSLDNNISKESQDEMNKQMNYFVSWFDEDISQQYQNQNHETGNENRESKQVRMQNFKKQSKKKMQIICFNLIFKSIKLAHECNLLTEKLARDWCKLLIMYINYGTKVLNEVVLATIECVLNAYPLSFSLIPILSQSFCKVNFSTFQDHEKLQIITYLVSVCSMIKKTIQKSKVTFLTNSTKSKNKVNSTDSVSNCSYIDVRADTFAVLTHAFEGLETVSENIDAAAFSLFIDDLYSSDESMFNLTETLIFSRLAHFEKKPSLTFCRLLLCLFPTHLELARKKCSKNLYDHLIEVPFNVLLKQEIRTTEIYEILSQCLVDIILTLQNGPIFNKTLAFITIETVPDENQKILSDKTKFLIANFNKPNGVIDISINSNKNEPDKPKYSYYAMSQNGAFYCVRNYQNSIKTDKEIDDNYNDYFIVESSLPLGSSRYRITPSQFLTVPQKDKFSNILKKKLNNVPEKSRPLSLLPQKICVSSNSYMFSQVPSSALLFKVLSLFSQSTLKFTTSLKSGNRAELQLNQLRESECSLLNSQSSFSAVPKQSKLLANETSSNNMSGSYPIPCIDEKSSIRSRSMSNISFQKSENADQITVQNVNRIFKRSQRLRQYVGVIYMEKGQMLNLNAGYCVNKYFFDVEDDQQNSDNDLQNSEVNNNNNDDNDKSSKENNPCSLDEAENGFVDNIIDDKVSFITQVPWKETSSEFKEFMGSLGSFHRTGRPIRKKQPSNINNNDDESNEDPTKENQQNDIRNDLLSIHYVDFHTDAIFLIGPFIGINSYQNSSAEGTLFSQEMYNKNCRTKSNFWKLLKFSHVLIIWNEDNTKFGINDDRNMMRVFIVISPVRNNLFKVSVIENFQNQQNPYTSQFLNVLPNSSPKADEILKMSSGPLFGDTIVPKRSLGELIRATAIYEDRKVRSIIESKEKEKEELYMEQIAQENEKKKKGRRNIFNNQSLDLKNQKIKKNKAGQNNEGILKELWEVFPDSFSFYY